MCIGTQRKNSYVIDFNKFELWVIFEIFEPNTIFLHYLIIYFILFQCLKALKYREKKIFLNNYSNKLQIQFLMYVVKNQKINWNFRLENILYLSLTKQFSILELQNIKNNLV